VRNKPNTVIDPDTPLGTLINVFTVEPSKQQGLIDLLDRATEEVMRHQPGFISANIHRSLDGRHVANYAQWQTADAFERMLENPEAQAHMKLATDIATVQPVLYQVASVHHI
jgi:quinol monooxygenase YgiN